MKYLCIILFALAHIAESTEPCRIIGLPENTERHGDVSILKVSRHDELQLSCRCPSYSPIWHILAIEDNISQFVRSPVGCADNGNTCSQTFIHPDSVSPGKFVFLNHTIQLNQTTLLQCFQRFLSQPQRDSLMLIANDQADPTLPTLQPSQTLTTSTIATVYSTPPPCDTSAPPVPTVTLTVCPTPSSRPDATKPEKSVHITVDAHSSSASAIRMPAVTPTSETPGIAGSLLKELGPTGLTLVPTVAVLVVIILALVITIIIIKYKHNKNSKPKEAKQTDMESQATTESDSSTSRQPGAENMHTVQYTTSPIQPRRTSFPSQQFVVETNHSCSVSDGISSTSR